MATAQTAADDQSNPFRPSLVSMKSFCLGILLSSLLIIPIHAQEIWDLESLSAPPTFRWDDDKSSIRSLLYKGATIDGKATEVFAFYADPSTVDGNGAPAKPYPAVVLIHGGGGTAFAEWVNLWARRGYAAIAMDLAGRRPPPPAFDPKSGALLPGSHAHKKESRLKLELGGLGHTHNEKFASIATRTTDDDWPLHAVTNVILAHSLIRSFSQVDAGRTAVTGISWGGYTTCIVASVDSRFKAAVPVYGCGFLHQGESVQKPSIDALAPEHRQQWITRYDPGSHLPKCRVPILFVNGTNDVHYCLDSYRKSYDAVPDGNGKNIRIEVNMRHGHAPGWAPEEIGLFVDSYCKNDTPLASITRLSSDQKRGLRASYHSETRIDKAQLHFTTDTGLQSKRKWQNRELLIEPKSHSLKGTSVPSEATTWFVSITDERGAMVSSAPQFAPLQNEAVPRPE